MSASTQPDVQWLVRARFFGVKGGPGIAASEWHSLGEPRPDSAAWRSMERTLADMVPDHTRDANETWQALQLLRMIRDPSAIVPLASWITEWTENEHQAIRRRAKRSSGWERLDSKRYVEQAHLDRKYASHKRAAACRVSMQRLLGIEPDERLRMTLQDGTRWQLLHDEKPGGVCAWASDLREDGRWLPDLYVQAAVPNDTATVLWLGWASLAELQEAPPNDAGLVVVREHPLSDLGLAPRLKPEALLRRLGITPGRLEILAGPAGESTT